MSGFFQGEGSGRVPAGPCYKKSTANYNLHNPTCPYSLYISPYLSPKTSNCCLPTNLTYVPLIVDLLYVRALPTILPTRTLKYYEQLLNTTKLPKHTKNPTIPPPLPSSITTHLHTTQPTLFHKKHTRVVKPGRVAPRLCTGWPRFRRPLPKTSFVAGKCWQAESTVAAAGCC